MGKERAEELMREEEGARSKEMIVEDKVKELEVFPTKVAAAAGKSCACEDRDAAYTRLAIVSIPGVTAQSYNSFHSVVTMLQLGIDHICNSFLSIAT